LHHKSSYYFNHNFTLLGFKSVTEEKTREERCFDRLSNQGRWEERREMLRRAQQPGKMGREENKINHHLCV